MTSKIQQKKCQIINPNNKSKDTAAKRKTQWQATKHNINNKLELAENAGTGYQQDFCLDKLTVRHLKGTETTLYVLFGPI